MARTAGVFFGQEYDGLWMAVVASAPGILKGDAGVFLLFSLFCPWEAVVAKEIPLDTWFGMLSLRVWGQVHIRPTQYLGRGAQVYFLEQWAGV